MKSLFVALLNRGAVYAAGFALVFFISHLVSKETFGQYSYVQAVIELSILFYSLGSGLSLTRLAAKLDIENVSQSIFYIVKKGAPFGLCVILLMLWPKFESGIVLIFGFLFSLLFSISLLFLAYIKGRGDTQFFIVEPAVRSIVFLVILCFFAYIQAEIGIVCLLSIQFFSLTLVVVYMWAKKWFRFSAPVDHGVPTAFRYSLFSFFSKKSDVLIIGLFSSFDFVASFKIAYLVAEAPAQFSQSFAFSKISKMGLADQGLPENFRQWVRLSVLIGVACSALGFLFVYIFTHTKSGYEDVVFLYLSMVIYFITRCFTVMYEQLFHMNLEMRELRRMSYIDLAVKFLGLSMYIMFNVNLIFVYSFFSVCDLVIHEIFLRKKTGTSMFEV